MKTNNPSRVTTLFGMASMLIACLTVFLGCTGGAKAATISHPEFKLFILRKVPSSHCTLGYLGVQSPTTPAAIIAHTLERPWLNNQPNVSSIPTGTYGAIVRYDKSDHWRIQLVGVPGRSGIQIHVGNEPNQSLGCILLGDRVDVAHCRVYNSQIAYQRLKRFFYGTANPNSTPDLKITVVVE